MTAETSTEIRPDELVQTVVSVFQTMLGIAVVECEPAPPESGPQAVRRLTSGVYLSGDWEGAVLVECDSQLACRLATRYVGMGDPGGSKSPCPCSEPMEGSGYECDMKDVVPDVLGELANMIGGNIKSVLNLGLNLSIPTVTEGDYVGQAAGYEVRQRFSFECADGVFQVIVLRPVV